MMPNNSNECKLQLRIGMQLHEKFDRFFSIGVACVGVELGNRYVAFVASIMHSHLHMAVSIQIVNCVILPDSANQSSGELS